MYPNRVTPGYSYFNLMTLGYPYPKSGTSKVTMYAVTLTLVLREEMGLGPPDIYVRPPSDSLVKLIYNHG